MNLILDTHVLLWAAGVPGQLSSEATALLEDGQHTLYFSSASIWEITIKRGPRQHTTTPVHLVGHRPGDPRSGWCPSTALQLALQSSIPSMGSEPSTAYTGDEAMAG